MNSAIPFLLSVSFLLSLTVMALLVWAVSQRLFHMGPDGAKVIFPQGQQPEDPARDYIPEESEQRKLDQSGRGPVLLLYYSATFWLLLGSLAGLITSIKFHQPDWLNQEVWLTFGRIRPVHLNAVAYGWASMAGLGVSLWLLPRLLRTPLRGVRYALAGGWLWNLGVAWGIIEILRGHSQGKEWLEFPWTADIMLAIAGALLGIPLLLTLRSRQVEHLYVSTWYVGASLLWFPFLFIIANWPGMFTGVSQAVLNWWFAHNVLGLWITPHALAAAYYFIPKILGKPIYSYQLSLLGFWSLALFYSQAGVHHLIGGPVPTWLVALSIVHSLAMFVPVIAVAINHHFTLKGNFHRLRTSATLRFVVTGSMLYTLVSLQGSLEALRTVNRVTHFTHYTVAHAHLGVYGFASFILFGSAYFIMPRLRGREWPHPSWINWHYAFSLGGLAVYFVVMTVAGVLQGRALLDPKGGFLQSLQVTQAFLPWRTLGGALMTCGHFIFAANLWSISRRSA